MNTIENTPAMKSRAETAEDHLLKREQQLAACEKDGAKLPLRIAENSPAQFEVLALLRHLKDGHANCGCDIEARIERVLGMFEKQPCPQCARLSAELSTAPELKQCPWCNADLHFRRNNPDSLEFFFVCGHLATVTLGFPKQSPDISEAGAAAMRRTLKWAKFRVEQQIDHMEMDGSFPEQDINEAKKERDEYAAALATTAGESLLARLMAAEKERDEALNKAREAEEAVIQIRKEACDIIEQRVEEKEAAEAERDTALARVKELEGQSAWRPIESAPKDGTKVLLLFPGGESCVAAWWECGDFSKWKIAHVTGYEWESITDDFPPTHWQPLPPPPAAADSQNQPTTNTQNT